MARLPRTSGRLGGMATLPYTPLRWNLYDPQELFAGFDPADPQSFAATADFAIYRHFVVEGQAGTIQEIFQDAAQDFYRSFEYFSPMVLLGTRYWRETFP